MDRARAHALPLRACVANRPRAHQALPCMHDGRARVCLAHTETLQAAGTQDKTGDFATDIRWNGRSAGSGGLDAAERLSETVVALIRRPRADSQRLCAPPADGYISR